MESKPKMGLSGSRTTQTAHRTIVMDKQGTSRIFSCSNRPVYESKVAAVKTLGEMLHSCFLAVSICLFGLQPVA